MLDVDFHEIDALSYLDHENQTGKITKFMHFRSSHNTVKEVQLL